MIVGIDEVGRGCWAGPVVAAAVVLHKDLSGLKDSKKLSALQRQRLAAVIRRHAAAIGIGWVPAEDVDRLGLTAAIASAMRQAVEQITAPYEQIVLDGTFDFLGIPNTHTIAKADDSVPAVSAASIIAKVARDTYMTHMAKLFPGYYFDQHVGYGTELHRNQLREFGICKLHRLSYRPVKMLAGV